MKNIKRISIQVFTLLLFVAIITGCPNNQQDADTEHGEMREEDHDHDHMDENSDMLMDSTSMEMDDDDMMD
jgi:predicted amino acid-binding ACT domain protein